MKCLEKDRARRYETADGLARDLERFLHDEPVEASPPSARDKLRRFARNHRVGLSMAAGFAIVLLVATAVSTWQAVRATRAGHAEAHQRRLADAAIEGERQARIDAQAGRAEAEHQKARAEAGENTAQEEKQIAQAVLDFLQKKLLRQASPETQADTLREAGGLTATALNPTIRDLLDRAANELAADKIDINFPKQPRVQAELLRTVGETYDDVGDYDRAIAFLQRSTALYQKQVGPEHPDTLTSMSSLAGAYVDSGSPELAIPLLEETFKLRKAKFGPYDHATLESMTRLGIAYEGAGRRDLAMPLLEHSLKLKKAKLGPENQDTIGGIDTLAVAYLEAGRVDPAVSLFEEALKLSKSKLGPDHPWTLTITGNLGTAYGRAGKMELSFPLLEESVKLSRAKLGPDHPDTLSSMMRLANTYADAKKLDRAVPLVQEILELQRTKLGPDHPDALYTMRDLAIMYVNARKPELGVPLLEQVLRLMKEKLSPGHPETVNTMWHLAESYRMGGKLDLAIPLLEEAVKLSTAKRGSDDSKTLFMMDRLAASYMAAGKPADATKLFWEVAPKKVKKITLLLKDNPSDPVRLAARASWYTRMGRFQEAVSDFRKAIELDPDEYRNWFAGLPLLLEVGDLERYRTMRPEALGRFESSSNTMIAERIGKVCLLLPGNAEEVTRASSAVDRAVAENPKDPGFWTSKAIAEYRRGHDQEVLKWLAKLLNDDDPLQAAPAQFFTAMALQRLGRRSEAKAAFDRGSTMMETKVPKPGQGGLGDDRWLLCDLARKEAQEVIIGAPSTRPDEGQ